MKRNQLLDIILHDVSTIRSKRTISFQIEDVVSFLYFDAKKILFVLIRSFLSSLLFMRRCMWCSNFKSVEEILSCDHSNETFLGSSFTVV